MKLFGKETKELTKESLLDLFESLYSVLKNPSLIYDIKELIIEKLDFNGGTEGIFAIRMGMVKGNIMGQIK